MANVIALRPNLAKQARIVTTPVPSSARDLQPRVDYPGAALSTKYVARLARYCVGDVLGVNAVLLVGKPRGPRKEAFARQLAIHLAHIVAGRRHQDVARVFHRNRSTASHHFEVVENLRDIEEFDAFLTVMEARFAHLLRAAETRPVEAWGNALAAMVRAVRRAELEADAHYDAKFVAETFKDRAIPAPTPKAKRRTTKRKCRKARRRRA